MIKKVMVMIVLLMLYACGDGTQKYASSPIFNGVFDIKGIQLGMPESDVTNHVPGLKVGQFIRKQSPNYKKLICKTRYADDPDGCHLTIANRTVETAEFYFQGDRLGQVWVKFTDDYFEMVDAGLTEKFGSPYSENSTSLNNRLTGVESTHIVKIWTDGKGRVLTLMNHEQEGKLYMPYGLINLVDSNFEKAIAADSAKLGSKPDNKDI